MIHFPLRGASARILTSERSGPMMPWRLEETSQE